MAAQGCRARKEEVMYTELLLGQGITDSGLKATGALIGGGLAIAGGAIPRPLDGGIP